ncbi:hypothetical protein DFH08DRAFT_941873 [Mycena albidolilacea]|uniref:Steroid 5-alpha reductase C-terminal domain-containing protein n=1 Tax=Mycena albidolilacea TaxID=1033008 RepID=A0AAD7EFU6_9AGAR|nr:hypothetical protein DFH08DRAFT_941873 [Mycena albidolilacea]
MSSGKASSSPHRIEGHLSHFRGNSETNVLGIATFALGRLSDAQLQYLLFTQGWAAKALAAVRLRASRHLISAGPGFAGMYAVASLRHAYWVLFTSNYNLPPCVASQIFVYNCIGNIINTLVAVNMLALSSYSAAGHFMDCIAWQQWAGLGLFAVGIAMETLSEESRKRFKKDPKNKGKIGDMGLWSFLRHPNFLGYLMWRMGTTLTTNPASNSTSQDSGDMISALFNKLQTSLSDFLQSPPLTRWAPTRFLIHAEWSLATTLVQFCRPSTGLSGLRVCFIAPQRSSTGNTPYVLNELNNPAVTSDSKCSACQPPSLRVPASPPNVAHSLSRCRRLDLTFCHHFPVNPVRSPRPTSSMLLTLFHVLNPSCVLPGSPS